MSIEENKALIHREVDDFWNTGNLDVIDEIFGADYVGHGPFSAGTENSFLPHQARASPPISAPVLRIS